MVAIGTVVQAVARAKEDCKIQHIVELGCKPIPPIVESHGKIFLCHPLNFPCLHAVRLGSMQVNCLLPNNLIKEKVLCIQMTCSGIHARR